MYVRIELTLLAGCVCVCVVFGSDDEDGVYQRAFE